MSTVTMREMLEAGVHFGHQTRYWNPQMAPYLFGQRNKIHIINLEKTLPLFNDAVNFIGKLAARKATILFVGTKQAAQKIIQEEALRCGMPFVNKRWLGGLLTNYKTVRQSINRLKTLEEMNTNGSIERMSKKEALQLARELNKLQVNLSGIKDMPGIPDAMVVIDVGYENIAISEASKLGIPVVGVVDSNNSPKGIDYIIPGNDDAIRSIRLYVKTLADTIIDGRGSVAQLMGEGGADEFVELDETGAPILEDKKSRRQERKVTRKKATRITVKSGTIEGDEDMLSSDTEVPSGPASGPEDQAVKASADATTPGVDITDKPATEAKDKSKTVRKDARTKTTTAKKPTISKKPAKKVAGKTVTGGKTGDKK
ncbi:MAG: ribosomal protein S2 [Gammaproteobacteria bacterium]|nr:ribosomal protein S2 [Gammaproteobacteria bacterium]